MGTCPLLRPFRGIMHIWRTNTKRNRLGYRISKKACYPVNFYVYTIKCLPNLTCGDDRFTRVACRYGELKGGLCCQVLQHRYREGEGLLACCIILYRIKLCVYDTTHDPSAINSKVKLYHKR
jgi:hypothetical protein